MWTMRSGSPPTSATAATMAGTGAASTPTRRAFPATSPTRPKAAARPRGWFGTDKGAGRGRRFPHRHLCHLHPRPRRRSAARPRSTAGASARKPSTWTGPCRTTTSSTSISTATMSGSPPPRGWAGRSAKATIKGVKRTAAASASDVPPCRHFASADQLLLRYSACWHCERSS